MGADEVHIPSSRQSQINLNFTQANANLQVKVHQAGAAGRQVLHSVSFGSFDWLDCDENK